MRASAATRTCRFELGRCRAGEGARPTETVDTQTVSMQGATDGGAVVASCRARTPRPRVRTQTEGPARRPMRASAATQAVSMQGATDGERSLILCVGAALAAARGRAGALRRKHRAGTSPAPTSDSCAARGRRGYGSQGCTGGTRPKARNAGIRGLAWSARRMKASLACWSGPSMAPKPSR